MLYIRKFLALYSIYNGILNFVGELCQIILSYVKFYTESENDIYIFHICDILAIIVVWGHKSYFLEKI